MYRQCVALGRARLGSIHKGQTQGSKEPTHGLNTYVVAYCAAVAMCSDMSSLALFGKMPIAYAKNAGPQCEVADFRVQLKRVPAE